MTYAAVIALAERSSSVRLPPCVLRPYLNVVSTSAAGATMAPLA
jgi:hypothetical protein